MRKHPPTSIILHKRYCVLCLTYKTVSAGCRIRCGMFTCARCAEKGKVP